MEKINEERITKEVMDDYETIQRCGAASRSYSFYPRLAIYPIFTCVVIQTNGCGHAKGENHEKG